MTFGQVISQPIVKTLPDNTQHLQAGFEPAVPASEQLQTHSIDHVATRFFINPSVYYFYMSICSFRLL